MKPPNFSYDSNLHEVPNDLEQVSRYIDYLLMKSPETVQEKVKWLGQLGFYHRIRHLLDESESALSKAIDLIKEHNLGTQLLIQQKIRLANTLQWQKKFSKSNALFDELKRTCESNDEARIYLDFVYQHAGKNYFDQGKYELALECFESALSLRMEKQAPIDQVESTTQAIQVVKNKLKEFT